MGIGQRGGLNKRERWFRRVRRESQRTDEGHGEKWDERRVRD